MAPGAGTSVSALNWKLSSLRLLVVFVAPAKVNRTYAVDELFTFAVDARLKTPVVPYELRIVPETAVELVTKLPQLDQVDPLVLVSHVMLLNAAVEEYCDEKLAVRSWSPVKSNTNTRDLPLADEFNTARAAGDVVVVLILPVAFTEEPEKAFSSRVFDALDTQLLDEFVPSAYNTPAPKLAVNFFG
jgi:hypothetical protein